MKSFEETTDEVFPVNPEDKNTMELLYPSEEPPSNKTVVSKFFPDESDSERSDFSDSEEPSEFSEPVCCFEPSLNTVPSRPVTAPTTKTSNWPGTPSERPKTAPLTSAQWSTHKASFTERAEEPASNVHAEFVIPGSHESVLIRVKSASPAKTQERSPSPSQDSPGLQTDPLAWTLEDIEKLDILEITSAHEETLEMHDKASEESSSQPGTSPQTDETDSKYFGSSSPSPHSHQEMQSDELRKTGLFLHEIYKMPEGDVHCPAHLFLASSQIPQKMSACESEDVKQPADKSDSSSSRSSVKGFFKGLKKRLISRNSDSDLSGKKCSATKNAAPAKAKTDPRVQKTQGDRAASELNERVTEPAQSQQCPTQNQRKREFPFYKSPNRPPHPGPFCFSSSWLKAWGRHAWGCLKDRGPLTLSAMALVAAFGIIVVTLTVALF